LEIFILLHLFVLFYLNANPDTPTCFNGHHFLFLSLICGISYQNGTQSEIQIVDRLRIVDEHDGDVQRRVGGRVAGADHGPGDQGQAAKAEEGHDDVLASHAARAVGVPPVAVAAHVGLLFSEK
jgi:hypothetical protein